MKKLIFTLFTLLSLGSTMVVQADTYTPAGIPASVFTNEWAPNTPANDMTLSNGLYVFAKRADFASNTSISFKVCKDHAWTTAYPGSNYGYTIPAGSKYLIITYNASGNAVNALGISSMTIAGDNGTLFGTTWSPSTAANDMTLLSDGTYKFEKEHVSLSAGTVNFKACANHEWDNAWPSSNYALSIPESGEYTITIIFNPATLTVTATADLEEAVVVIPAIQLHSNITNPSWESSANFDIAANEETASLTLSVAEGSYQFGVKIDGTWTSNGASFTRANPSRVVESGSGNCTFTADIDGDYTFTWTYATNTLTVTYPDLPAQSVDFDGLDAQILKGTTVNFAATSSGITNPGYRFYVKAAGGSYGSAVTSYTFNTVGSFVVKVDALANNTGSAVATKEKNVKVYDTKTFTSGTVIYVDFSAMTEGSKGVNFPFGDTKDALDYDAAGAGTVKTVTFSTNVTWSTQNDFIKTEKNGWAGLKFTVPSAGQNCAVVAADGASYTWTTVAPTIKMHGNFTGEWATTAAFEKAAGNATASLELAITTAGEKSFGMRIGSDDNWTSNGASITRASTSAEITAGSGNCTLNADVTGTYTFTWTYATNTLSVTYPAVSMETYHLYVRDLTGWDTFDVYAWGDSEYLGGWPGKTAANSTTTIDGVTYKVYDFEAIEDATIEMNLIFHNNVGQDLPGDYRLYLDLTTARNCTISVSGIAAWEGLSGVKRFRACEPLEHVYGYQYDAEGPTGTEWPGDELIADGEGWYSYIVTKGRTVIFNNGTGEGAMQTGDFAYTDADPVADECAVWQGATNVSDKIYMFTIDDCDAACTVTYERDVTNGNYGTICLPYNAVSVTGATLYSIAGKSGDGYGEGIYIDQEDELLMGVPYIFLASADKIVVRYWEGQSFTPSADHLYSHNGLVGFINDGEYYTVTANAHNYILYNNGLYFVNSEAKIASNRAFIDWSDVPGDAPAPVTSRRSIQVYQTPTGWTIVPEEGHDACRKVLRDGSLLIERNGNTYNAVGQMVK